jgi:hypothetical protein
LPDPAAIEDPDEARLAFAATVRAIEARVDALLALSDDELTSQYLKQIGAMK